MDNAKDSIFLFFDGGLKSTLQNNTAISGSNTWDLTIGNGWTGEKSFKGSIDDIRIYNRVLDESEILSLYNEGKYSDVVIDINIEGNDTVCAGQGSEYTVLVNDSLNKYLFRDTASKGNLTTGYP